MGKEQDAPLLLQPIKLQFQLKRVTDRANFGPILCFSKVNGYLLWPYVYYSPIGTKTVPDTLDPSLRPLGYPAINHPKPRSDLTDFTVSPVLWKTRLNSSYLKFRGCAMCWKYIIWTWSIEMTQSHNFTSDVHYRLYDILTIYSNWNLMDPGEVSTLALSTTLLKRNEHK